MHGQRNIFKKTKISFSGKIEVQRR